MYETMAKKYSHEAVLVGILPSNDFIDDEDVKETKNTLWDMYNDLMMSDADISTEARQDYTFVCLRIVELLNTILKAHKELSKEFKNLNGSSSS